MSELNTRPTKKLYRSKYFWYAIVLALVVGAAVYYNTNKYPFINKKIDELVADKTNSLYKVEYDSISVDEVGGDLYIHNLSIKGDTLLQEKYMLAGDTAAASMLLDIFVPVLKVVGFKTKRALLNKQIACDKIIITDPRVTIYVFPGVAKRSDVQKQGQELYKQLLGNFTLIQADSLSIVNTEVVARNFFTREIKFHTFNTSINLADLRIDSSHYADTSRTLFCKEISLHSDKVIVGDEPVIAEATFVTFDTRNKILGIAEIAYNGIKNGGDFSGKVKGIAITGIEAAGAIDSMNIIINKAIFKEAALQLQRTAKEEGKAIRKTSDNKLLNGWIKSFRMSELKAVNVSLNMLSNDRKQKDVVIKNSAIKVYRLALDTTSEFDKSLLKSADDINISNDLISFKSKDNVYDYSFSGIQVNKAAGTIGLNEFSIKPALGEVAFANKAKVQKDRYHVRIRNLLASSVDFEKLTEGNISVGTIKTSGNSVLVYRDISKPSDSIRKVGNYPHQMLHNLKVPLSIKRFILANTLIEYKEHNPLSDTSGTLRFVNSTMTLTNVTNADKPANKIMNLDFTGSLLGKAPLNINIKFYLDKVAEGRYDVTTLGKTPFAGASLNPMIVPMGMVRIDKGTINELSFNFRGDNLQADGTFIIKYEDLKLALLKHDKKNNSFNKKGIVSLLANVIVKNNNPSNGKTREAKIVYKRDEYKSFFNMIWKFAFVGLKDVMGAKL
jgi:hypothetical protein